MEGRVSEDRGSGKLKLLHSVDAFVAGLLFFLGILFAFVETPSDLIGMLTDLVVHFSWDNQVFSLSVAATMLVIAIWRSWQIYRSKVITRSMQFGLGIFACALVVFKIFLFAIGLRAAILNGIMSM